MKNDELRELLLKKGRELYRDMPWREDTRPYYVLVSELMLQQTQVPRVIPKFKQFIARFPDEKSLAAASLADVLTQWQGLGYNRRAKFLHEAAKQIIKQGSFPQTMDGLMRLPGVGKNTAGAILAYSFNQPSIFIETNIRTAYIHHFFADDFAVDDKQIIEKLSATIDRKNPRRFYQNMMDYGTWLKLQGIRNNARSRHYKKQPSLKGSVREVRGMIVRELVDVDLLVSELQARLPKDERFEKALAGLLRDGLVARQGNKVHLTK